MRSTTLDIGSIIAFNKFQDVSFSLSITQFTNIKFQSFLHSRQDINFPINQSLHSRCQDKQNQIPIVIFDWPMTPRFWHCFTWLKAKADNCELWTVEQVWWTFKIKSKSWQETIAIVLCSTTPVASVKHPFQIEFKFTLKCNQSSRCSTESFQMHLIFMKMNYPWILDTQMWSSLRHY